MTLDEQLRTFIAQQALPIELEEVAIAPIYADPIAPSRFRLLPKLIVGCALVATTIGLVAALGNNGQVDGPVFHRPASDLTWVEVAEGDGAFQSPIESENGPALAIPPFTVADLVNDGTSSIIVGSAAVGTQIQEPAIWRISSANLVERIPSPEVELDPSHANFTPAGTSLSHIATADDGNLIVALGTANNAAIEPIWMRSRDGITWESGPIITDATVIAALPKPQIITTHGLVATTTGFLAFGQTNTDLERGETNQVLLWQSTDGSTWMDLDSPFKPGEFVRAVTRYGERIVAVGSVGGFDGQPAAWTSDDDGETWASANMTEANSNLPIAVLSEVASGPDGLLAIGERRSIDGPASTKEGDGPLALTGVQDLTLWHSDDGSAWTEVLRPATPDTFEWGTAIVHGPAGFLIIEVQLGEEETVTSLLDTIDGSDITVLERPTRDNLIALGGGEAYTVVTGRTGFDQGESHDAPTTVWRVEATD